MLMGLSLLKIQFTNLCKSPCLKFTVLKFTVKFNESYAFTNLCKCVAFIEFEIYSFMNI